MLLLGLSMITSSCDNNQTSYDNTSEKEFVKAFENKECIYFRTNYVSNHDTNKPLFYLVLYPFVFSDNGLRGIMYIVTYGTRKYDGHEVSSLYYWGEYEVVGNYLRLNNIVDVMYKEAHPWPIIYKISQTGMNLQLEGEFIKKNETSIYVQEQQPIPDVIVNLLESDKYNIHSY